MKHCTKLAILTILLFIKPLWADENHYWQCTASDSENKRWAKKSMYERAATNKAFDACKKQSNVPASCKADLGVCEGFEHGISVSPLWQCMALDQNAKPWIGNSYGNMDEAAIAAKTRCVELSADPDSCYINLLTCKNLRSS